MIKLLNQLNLYNIVPFRINNKESMTLLIAMAKEYFKNKCIRALTANAKKNLKRLSVLIVALLMMIQWLL